MADGRSPKWIQSRRWACEERVNTNYPITQDPRPKTQIPQFPMHSLTAQPATDPTSIYRCRDGLYAADLLTAALVSLDFFTWLNDHPSDKSAICRALEIKERPTDVMLTLFSAMGFLRRENEIFSLTDFAREHLVKTSPWFIGPYYASLKERPVCRDS